MGTIGRVQTVEKNGKKVRSLYVTKGVQLEQGDVIYFNDIKESYDRLAQNKVISPAEALEKVEAIATQDSKYGRTTNFIANLFRKKKEEL